MKLSERGEALLELVLFAPILLLIGTVAAERGGQAIQRARAVDRVRAAMSSELVKASQLTDGENAIEALPRIIVERLTGAFGSEGELSIEAALFTLNDEGRSVTVCNHQVGRPVPQLEPVAVEKLLRSVQQHSVGKKLLSAYSASTAEPRFAQPMVVVVSLDQRSATPLQGNGEGEPIQEIRWQLIRKRY